MDLAGHRRTSLGSLCPGTVSSSAAATSGSTATVPVNRPLLDHFRPQERLPKSLARRDDRAGSALTWSPKDEILSLSSATGATGVTGATKPREEESIFLDTASTVGDSLRRGANGHRPLAANGPAHGTSPRWAPPAPHLLPPLPPMSYELRCWIQALERAQNPSAFPAPPGWRPRDSTGSLKDSAEGVQAEATAEVIANLQKEVREISRERDEMREVLESQEQQLQELSDQFLRLQEESAAREHHLALERDEMAAELQRLRAEWRTLHVHAEAPRVEEPLEHEEPKIQVDLRMARDNLRNVMHANTFIRNMKGLVKN